MECVTFPVRVLFEHTEEMHDVSRHACTYVHVAARHGDPLTISVNFPKCEICAY